MKIADGIETHRVTSSTQIDLPWAYKRLLIGRTVWSVMRKPGIAILFVAIPKDAARILPGVQELETHEGVFKTEDLTIRPLYIVAGREKGLDEEHRYLAVHFGPECAWPKQEVASDAS